MVVRAEQPRGTSNAKAKEAAGVKKVAGRTRKDSGYRRIKQIKKYIKKDERLFFFSCLSGLSRDTRYNSSSSTLSLLCQLTSLAWSSSSVHSTPVPIPLTLLSASLTLGPSTF